ncbi:MbtH family NRPS accessory protein [Streptomyces lancefieldiae]|uniref:MbtH family NRPS accessory protein n=1 Tax=Streptomyces lancefieldiae TaxID=3075520 RepID=A0ABU3AQJ6_9ACTN|nr:MbtH family NRPS accessory protein [Streptomyces sp. DSM 40712]MDT0612213.1 MbtH family NRPS accessory protein [Streptomyces sp. DSM 40712]
MASLSRYSIAGTVLNSRILFTIRRAVTGGSGVREQEGQKYPIVVNGEEQYSIRPLDQAVPAGWNRIGVRGRRNTVPTISRRYGSPATSSDSSSLKPWVERS